MLRYYVRWSNVKEVFAFKLDLLTVDCICLGFHVSQDTGEYTYQVTEEMSGYRELVEKMQCIYPDHNKDWWTQVAFPAFATNYITIWRRPSN